MGRSLRFRVYSTRLKRPIRTRFRFGSKTLRSLTSPDTVTRRLIMQKARRHGSCPLRPLASARFQVLFTPIPWVLFTFPSRYLFTIGHQRVFRLSGWSRQIHTGLHESGITWDTKNKIMKFRLQGSHLLCRTFPRPSSISLFSDLLN